MHVALQRAGCAFRPEHPVTRIAAREGGFDLTTPAGIVTTEKIVLAAGLGNVKLAPMVGLAAPLRPQKGQVLVLERMRPFLPVPLSTIRQTDEGTVLIGDSQEEAGFDDSGSTRCRRPLQRAPCGCSRNLRDVHVTRAWAALAGDESGWTSPMYEQSTTHPGAYIASCHSGVTLAAVHAQVLAPAIANGPLPASLAPFSTRRFDVSKAA